MSQSHSIEKILSFTAALFIKETGGNRNYLNPVMDSRGNITEPSHLTWQEKAVPVGIMSVSAGIALGNIVDILSHGFSALLFISLLININIAFFSYRALVRFKENKNKRNLSQRERILHFEPEALWSVDYLTTETRGKLVLSLLGARMLCRKMIAFTTIPMDQDVIDARVSHLVKELSNPKSAELHPYLVQEAMSFCTQAVKQMDFYHPMITLQDDLRKMDLGM